MSNTAVKAIIFDIGDVLCSWKAPTTSSINPKLFKEFLNSSTWYEYDCGMIGQDECFTRLACQGGVPVQDLTAAFQLARDSLVPHDGVVAAIRELRAIHADLNVYAMSNISRPDWEVIANRPLGWDIFDRVFTSCEAGMRKPELRFYHHVLRETGTLAGDAVFIDDKSDNVVAARSLGFREAIIFDTASEVRRKLLNVLGEPTQRCRAWMQSEAQGFHSETERGDVIVDNFAPLLTYEVTGYEGPLSNRHYARTWNYLAEAPTEAARGLPNDVDTTSYAFGVLPLNSSVAHSIMDEMVSPEQTSADGIVKVYFDRTRDRIDAAVCINVVRMFYKFGRGSDVGLQATKDWIRDVLFFRGYQQGTRYYPQPDVFLYFFARLVADNATSDVFRSTAALLRERLMERINRPADSLGLAMRVLACHHMGIRDESDLQRLLTMQQDDGSFGLGWLCQYGTTGMKVGNRVLTAALALAAMEALRGPKKRMGGGDADSAHQQSGTGALVPHEHVLTLPIPA